MEKNHNVNFQPLALVRTWNTERIQLYMNEVKGYIDCLEKNESWDDNDLNQNIIVLKRLKNYEKELNSILIKR